MSILSLSGAWLNLSIPSDKDLREYSASLSCSPQFSYAERGKNTTDRGSSSSPNLKAQHRKNQTSQRLINPGSPILFSDDKGYWAAN
jgi:hypothetical protein